MSEMVNPFISSVELRTLEQDMYPQAKPNIFLCMVGGYDPTGNSIVRY